MIKRFLFRSVVVLASIALFLCWPQSSPLQARSGFADLSFGRAGITTTDFGGKLAMSSVSRMEILGVTPASAVKAL
jgi:hypothetical protein